MSSEARITLFFSVVLTCSSAGQVPEASLGIQQTTIRSSAREVLIDVSVRNRGGGQIRGLQSADFVVSEDGIDRRITSFRYLDGVAPADPVAKTGSLDPMREVRLVTMVLDRLPSIDGRRIARQGALDLLSSNLGHNSLISVFSIDRSLRLLQQYTNDRTLLDKAVVLGTGGSSSDFTRQSDELRNALKGLFPGKDRLLESTSTAGDGGPPPLLSMSAEADRDTEIAAMTRNMLEFSERTARTEAGRPSIQSLMAIVSAQTGLPGTKTIIYFSEGIEIPSSLASEFHRLIQAANRAGVRVYAIDARGLLGQRQAQRGAAELHDAMIDAGSEMTTLIEGGGREQQNAVTPARVRAMERGEESIRMDVQTSLAELAEGTGGVLIANTNDLRKPLERVAGDIRSHYELAYVPSLEREDGRFRKINVKVLRAGAQVQTRSGYFALPATMTETLAPWEPALLMTLSSPPLRAFHRSGLLHFRKTDAGVECSVGVEIPFSELKLLNDETGKVYRGHVSVLALLKTEHGDVVEKIGQDVLFTIPADKMVAARNGSFVFTEHRVMAPGRYTLESAVLDRNADQAGAGRVSVFVPDPPAGIALSDIFMIRRVDLKSGTGAADPLQFSESKVIPRLTNAVIAGESPDAAFCFVLYPDRRSPEQPKLTINVYRNGKLAAKSIPKLGMPDAGGRIPYFGSAKSTLPGDYVVRVTAEQGGVTTSEAMSFVVASAQ